MTRYFVVAIACFLVIGAGTSCAPSSPTVYSEWPSDAKEAVTRQEQTAKALGIEKEMSLDLGDGLSMRFVLIPAGTFTMGSPTNEQNRFKNEGPQHEVTITKPFYMGVHEVTQEQWGAVMGTEPWKDKETESWKDKYCAKTGANHAVSYVRWEEAVEFCKKLSQRAHIEARLPTEAEWEYACRAGTTTRFYHGDDKDLRQLGDYAWYEGNSYGIGERYAHAVGQKKPNAWGLYDMYGNVFEPCSDWYADSYENAKSVDPQGPETGKLRVYRGGTFHGHGWTGRSALRGWNDGDGCGYVIHTGIRVVVSP